VLQLDLDPVPHIRRLAGTRTPKTIEDEDEDDGTKRRQ